MNDLILQGKLHGIQYAAKPKAIMLGYVSVRSHNDFNHSMGKNRKAPAHYHSSMLPIGLITSQAICRI